MYVNAVSFQHRNLTRSYKTCVCQNTNNWGWHISSKLLFNTSNPGFKNEINFGGMSYAKKMNREKALVSICRKHRPTEMVFYLTK